MDEKNKSFKDSDSSKKGAFSKTQVKCRKSLDLYQEMLDKLKNLHSEVPKNELIYDEFRCSIHKEVIMTGKLYIGTQCIWFYGNFMKIETSVAIKWTDIVSITKEKTAFVIPNGIEIVTAKEKILFSVHSNREKYYLKLHQSWKFGRGDTTKIDMDTKLDFLLTYLKLDTNNENREEVKNLIQSLTNIPSNFLDIYENSSDISGLYEETSISARHLKHSFSFDDANYCDSVDGDLKKYCSYYKNTDGGPDHHGFNNLHESAAVSSKENRSYSLKINDLEMNSNLPQKLSLRGFSSVTLSPQFHAGNLKSEVEQLKGDLKDQEQKKKKGKKISSFQRIRNMNSKIRHSFKKRKASPKAKAKKNKNGTAVELNGDSFSGQRLTISSDLNNVSDNTAVLNHNSLHHFSQNNILHQNGTQNTASHHHQHVSLKHTVSFRQSSPCTPSFDNSTKSANGNNENIDSAARQREEFDSRISLPLFEVNENMSMVAASVDECDCEHLSDLLIDEEFLASYKEVYYHLFDKSSEVTSRFNAEKKLKNIKHELLSKNNESNFTRRVSYTVILQWLKKTIKTITTQKITVGEGHIKVLSESVSTGMPYSDCFTTKIVYCIKSVGNGKSNVKITAKINYIKSVFFVTKKVLDKEIKFNLSDFVNTLIGIMKEKINKENLHLNRSCTIRTTSISSSSTDISHSNKPLLEDKEFRNSKVETVTEATSDVNSETVESLITTPFIESTISTITSIASNLSNTCSSNPIQFLLLIIAILLFFVHWNMGLIASELTKTRVLHEEMNERILRLLTHLAENGN